jgi:hypothetical protein
MSCGKVRAFRDLGSTAPALNLFFFDLLKNCRKLYVIGKRMARELNDELENGE